VAFLSNDPSGQILTMNANGSDRAQLTDFRDQAQASAAPTGPLYSPDGRAIAYGISSLGSGPKDFNIDIWAMDETGGNEVQLSNVPNSAEQLGGWSPDGERIAYALVPDSYPGAGSGTAIWTMANNGSGAKLVTSGPDPANDPVGDPSYFPDGRRLLFSVFADGSDEGLWSVGLDGRGLRQLTHGYDMYGSVSPDGKRIAFDRLQGPQAGLLLANPDGSGVTPVAAPGTGAVPGVAWSPDGSQILFAAIEGEPLPSTKRGAENLYVANADGTGAAMIAPNIGEAYFLDWQRRIVSDGSGLCHSAEGPIVGTSAGNELNGTGERNTIAGQAGDDILSSGAGTDTACGGTGNDRVLGGAGADRLGGGPGNDRLVGGPGRDRLFGGPGNDRLVGGPGDILRGGPGKDRIIRRRP